MMVLRFSMQGEYVFERTNGKCQVSSVYISICKGKILLSILMPNVICVRFGQLLDRGVT